jgi:hypothetical protein
MEGKRIYLVHPVCKVRKYTNIRAPKDNGRMLLICIICKFRQDKTSRDSPDDAGCSRDILPGPEAEPRLHHLISE